MSMIISNSNGREVELPQETVATFKAYGLETEMDTTSMIQTLNQVKLHLVAHGNPNTYRRLKEAVDELETWPEENLQIQY